MESYISRWAAPNYRPQHMGPLWMLWRLGLAPTKRQADLLLMFIIVSSATWTYYIIMGYTDLSLEVLQPYSVEGFLE
jgi:hypothetical protein